MTQNRGGRPRQMPNDEAALRALAEKYRALGSIRALVSDTGYAYGTVQRNLRLAADAGYVQVKSMHAARSTPTG
jgi:hypothetical protein